MGREVIAGAGGRQDIALIPARCRSAQIKWACNFHWIRARLVCAAIAVPNVGCVDARPEFVRRDFRQFRDERS